MPHYDDNHDGFLIEPYEHFGPEQDRCACRWRSCVRPVRCNPSAPHRSSWTPTLPRRRWRPAPWKRVGPRRKLLYSQEAKQTIAHIMDRRTDMAIPGNPGSVNEITMGGMTEPVVQAYGFATALVNRFGPSVLQAKGVNSGADTATGDTIKAGNANIVFRLMARPA